MGADALLGARADGMLDPASLGSDKVPVTIRAVFIIGPDKKLKLSLNCELPSLLSRLTCFPAFTNYHLKPSKGLIQR